MVTWPYTSILSARSDIQSRALVTMPKTGSATSQSWIQYTIDPNKKIIKQWKIWTLTNKTKLSVHYYSWRYSYTTLRQPNIRKCISI